MSGDPPSVRQFVALGSTMVGCIVGGLVVGLVIDHFAHTTPVLALVGVGVGLVGAGLALYERARSFL